MTIIINKFYEAGPWRVTVVGDNDPDDIGHYWANTELEAIVVARDVLAGRALTLESERVKNCPDCGELQAKYDHPLGCKAALRATKSIGAFGG